MKTLILYFFLAVFITFTGCKTSQKPQPAAVSPEKFTTKTEEKTEPSPPTPASKPPDVIIIDNSHNTAQSEPATSVNINVQITQPPVTNPDSIFATLERTPCYGRCPTYKITVYNSGFAIYEGIRFVEKIGKFSTRLSVSEMQMLLLKAKEIDYFNLSDVYDSQVTDIPSTVSSLNAEGRKKTIKARFNVPARLRDYEKFFDDLFAGKIWTLVSQH